MGVLSNFTSDMSDRDEKVKVNEDSESPLVEEGV